MPSLPANHDAPETTLELKMTGCMSDRWQVNLPPKKSCNLTSQLPKAYINSGLLLNINWRQYCWVAHMYLCRVTENNKLLHNPWPEVKKKIHLFHHLLFVIKKLPTNSLFHIWLNFPPVSISYDKYDISFGPGDKPGMQICIIG